MDSIFLMGFFDVNGGLRLVFDLTIFSFYHKGSPSQLFYTHFHNHRELQWSHTISNPRYLKLPDILNLSLTSGALASDQYIKGKKVQLRHPCNQIYCGLQLVCFDCRNPKNPDDLGYVGIITTKMSVRCMRLILVKDPATVLTQYINDQLKMLHAEGTRSLNVQRTLK